MISLLFSIILVLIYLIDDYLVDVLIIVFNLISYYL